MKKIIYLFLGISMAIVGCDDSPKNVESEQKVERRYDTTVTGLVYRVLKEGTGNKIADQDLAIVHLAGYANNGEEELENTWKAHSPRVVRIGSGILVKGLEEGIKMMKIGDSYEFIIPPDLGYGANPALGIPENAELLYQVQLLGVKSVPLVTYDTTGITPEITGSGIQCYWITKTNGKRAEPGQTVQVMYSGQFMNGRKFDSSYDREAPIYVELGKRQVISGWEEILQKMRVGEKGRFIIPYYLAYGENGKKGIIPPKSDLVFDIELLGIEEEK